jgi:hypothetical protein
MVYKGPNVPHRTRMCENNMSQTLWHRGRRGLQTSSLLRKTLWLKGTQSNLQNAYFLPAVFNNRI